MADSSDSEDEERMATLRWMKEQESALIYYGYGGIRLPMYVNGEMRGPFPSKGKPVCYYGNFVEMRRLVQGLIMRTKMSKNADMDKQKLEMMFTCLVGIARIHANHLIETWEEMYPPVVEMVERRVRIETPTHGGETVGGASLDPPREGGGSIEDRRVEDEETHGGASTAGTSVLSGGIALAEAQERASNFSEGEEEEDLIDQRVTRGSARGMPLGEPLPLTSGRGPGRGRGRGRGSGRGLPHSGPSVAGRGDLAGGLGHVVREPPSYRLVIEEVRRPGLPCTFHNFVEMLRKKFSHMEEDAIKQADEEARNYPPADSLTTPLTRLKSLEDLFIRMSSMQEKSQVEAKFKGGDVLSLFLNGYSTDFWNLVSSLCGEVTSVNFDTVFSRLRINLLSLEKTKNPTYMSMTEIARRELTTSRGTAAKKQKKKGGGGNSHFCAVGSGLQAHVKEEETELNPDAGDIHSKIDKLESHIYHITSILEKQGGSSSKELKGRNSVKHARESDRGKSDKQHRHPNKKAKWANFRNKDWAKQVTLKAVNHNDRVLDNNIILCYNCHQFTPFSHMVNGCPYDRVDISADSPPKNNYPVGEMAKQALSKREELAQEAFKKKNDGRNPKQVRLANRRPSTYDSRSSKSPTF